ncbi:hypothetical protein [Natrinema soli]|uniref:Thiamine pyrophosphate enzyme central domain-containing protein n=1 Tax=Natrinema soli TaxID=1930624 RepID=A0ABD5SQW3_9EURY|nr:hypothetical protein [Natrinema soli]
MEIPDLGKFEPPSKMAPDWNAIETAADRLVAADMPVVLTDQVGNSRNAVESLIGLAELLGAPVVDSRRRRYNFPNTHPLDLTGTEVYRDADGVLALDIWSLNYRLKNVDRVRNELTEAIDGEFDLINVGPHELGASSLTADYYALRETEIPRLADTEHAIPVLVDVVEERLAATPSRRRACEKRFDELKAKHEA